MASTRKIGLFAMMMIFCALCVQGASAQSIASQQSFASTTNIVGGDPVPPPPGGTAAMLAAILAALGVS